MPTHRDQKSPLDTHHTATRDFTGIIDSVPYARENVYERGNDKMSPLYHQSMSKH
jgi:hypothetical protein